MGEQRHADDRGAEAGQPEDGVGENDGEGRGGDGGERQVGHAAAAILSARPWRPEEGVDGYRRRLRPSVGRRPG